MEPKVILKSNDGQEFDLNENLFSQSLLITRSLNKQNIVLIEIDTANGSTVELILNFMEKQLERISSGEDSSDFIKWQERFLKRIMSDDSTMYTLLKTACALEIKHLVDLVCKTIAEAMAGKSVEEIRKILHITNDFSAAEEHEARREIDWAMI